MKVTVRRRTTVRGLLADARAKYGTLENLEARVRKNPGDHAARLALHDVHEYAGDDPDKPITETRELVVPDSAVDELTASRIHLILKLGQLKTPVTGIRELSRLLDRDVKNVSRDVHALRQLGLLEVRAHGRGRAAEVFLPGDEIDLHLLEAS